MLHMMGGLDTPTSGKVIVREVVGREHGERVIKLLEKNGYNIVME